MVFHQEAQQDEDRDQSAAAARGQEDQRLAKRSHHTLHRHMSRAQSSVYIQRIRTERQSSSMRLNLLIVIN